MPRLNGSAVSAVPCAFSLGAVSIAPTGAKGGVPGRAPAPAPAPAPARGGVGIVAPLAGPPLGAAGLVPVGQAWYWERGVRDLTCEVHNVDLPNFTLCTLSLNDIPLMTTPLFAGVAVFPILTTMAGEVVPVCQPGDGVTITAAGFGPILWRGLSAAPPVLPLPLVNRGYRLTGPALAGFLPLGGRGYTLFPGLGNQTFAFFTCEVLPVNLPVGSALNVVRFPVNGDPSEIVGTIVLDALHHGMLIRSSAPGNPPTPMFPGDVIAMVARPQIILSGTLG
jgi:hypothetical protein